MTVFNKSTFFESTVFVEQFSLSNRVWFYLPFLLASATEREAKETEPQGPHPTVTTAAPLVFIFWFCV